MPVVYLPLQETYVNVTRPVNINVAEQIQKICGINDQDFRISYHGTVQASKSTGSELKTDKTPGDNRFGNSGKFSIDVREEYSPLTQHFGQARTIQRRPVFADPRLGVYVEPQYHQMETTVSVTYRTPNYNAARVFVDRMRNRIDRDMSIMVHELQYEFPMPKEAIVILMEIHRLRELKGGYGETWKDWFYDCAAQNVDILTKMDGKEGLVSFKEKQVNVHGWFTDNNPPEPQKGQAGEYTVEFQYKYNYDRPANMRFIYPLMVHNSILPSKFRPAWVSTRYEYLNAQMSLVESYLDYFRRENVTWDENLDGVRLPMYDSTRLPDNPMGYKCLLRALVQVDTENPRTLFNIKELGAYSLSEGLIEHLIANREDVTAHMENIFKIELIRNGHVLSHSAISLDEEGNLSTNFDMDVRSTYHVRLLVLHDLSILSSRGVESMSKSPEMGLTLLSSLGVPDAHLPKVIGNGKLIPKHQITALYPTIQAVRKGKSKFIPDNVALVGRFIIKTHRS